MNDFKVNKIDTSIIKNINDISSLKLDGYHNKVLTKMMNALVGQFGQNNITLKIEQQRDEAGKLNLKAISFSIKRPASDLQHKLEDFIQTVLNTVIDTNKSFWKKDVTLRDYANQKNVAAKEDTVIVPLIIGDAAFSVTGTSGTRG